MIRTCVVCGTEFESKSSRALTCRNECRCERMAAVRSAYCEANRGYVHARRKAYFKANRERITAVRRAYLKANRERLRAWRKAFNKAYYEANQERLRARNKAYYEANRERLIAWQKAYYEANREYAAAWHKTHEAQLRIAPTIIRGIFGDEMAPRVARNTLKGLGLIDHHNHQTQQED
jgi:hypothetical protein